MTSRKHVVAGRVHRSEPRAPRHSAAACAFRLEMAQVERIWAGVSGKSDGWSVRKISKSVGLSPTRVHQLLADPGAALMEHAMSALRGLGWPAPEDHVDTTGSRWPIGSSTRPRF